MANAMACPTSRRLVYFWMVLKFQLFLLCGVEREHFYSHSASSFCLEKPLCPRLHGSPGFLQSRGSFSWTFLSNFAKECANNLANVNRWKMHSFESEQQNRERGEGRLHPLSSTFTPNLKVFQINQISEKLEMPVRLLPFTRRMSEFDSNYFSGGNGGDSRRCGEVLSGPTSSIYGLRGRGCHLGPLVYRSSSVVSGICLMLLICLLSFLIRVGFKFLSIPALDSEVKVWKGEENGVRNRKEGGREGLRLRLFIRAGMTLRGWIVGRFGDSPESTLFSGGFMQRWGCVECCQAHYQGAITCLGWGRATVVPELLRFASQLSLTASAGPGSEGQTEVMKNWMGSEVTSCRPDRSLQPDRSHGGVRRRPRP